MQWTCHQLARIVNGRLLPAPQEALVTGVSTDSRTLQSGDLFVPLKGPNYDGHDYLRQAVEHGAAACLSEEVVGGLPVPVIQVRDTLEALGILAHDIRKEFHGPVAAITGTTGKTSTKEMLASILAVREPGLRTQGNFNNLIGLPLTLARLDETDCWIVLEMGMSQPGEISRLARIAEPTLGVLTNVGAGHLQGLGDIQGVARAKGELLTSLKPGCAAVVNRDDAELMRLPLPAGVRRVTYGLGEQADVRASAVEPGPQTCFVLELAGCRRHVTLPLPGRHQVYNALAAAAAAHLLGRDPDEIVAGLESVKMSAGRLEVRELDRGMTLLDDSYNANPQSMQAALEVLRNWPCQGQRIAVLADMLELGEASACCHHKLGQIAARSADWLLVLGERRHDVMTGAAVKQTGASLANECLIPCESHEQICDWLKRHLQPQDCVLVKGSRGMRMERIVRFLLHRDGDGA
ncbi:MAG: UDP-N-acetylmuramoyl-tripeptide--D-alanyl-D-alanine ligase [Desulfuromonadaceae bacterium]|nr:UDP-N-acetylmuramoyl-tripeptide--D-alanyl-D-alanine ligase [Desulfuromonadaceae bacterium]